VPLFHLWEFLLWWSSSILQSQVWSLRWRLLRWYSSWPRYSLSLPIIRVCLTVWSHIAVFMKRTPADVLRSFRVAAPVYVPTDYPPTSQQTKQFDLTTSPHVVQTQHSKSVQMISASTFAEVAGPVNYVHRTAFAVCDMCIRVLIRMCMPVHTHANAQTHKYMHTHTHTRHIDTHTSIH